jgi:ATP-binding protein involved in chromosome partitioning
MPDGSKNELFGSGGGSTVAAQLSTELGYPVPLLGQIPIEVEMRVAGDSGTPWALSDGESTAQQALRSIADELGHRSRGLAGRNLGVAPV